MMASRMRPSTLVFLSALLLTPHIVNAEMASEILRIEVAPRFATPRDGDPLLALLPNSPTYVTNQAVCPRPATNRREADVHLQVSFSIALPAGTPARIALASTALGGDVELDLGTDGTARRCLPQGTYSATLIWREQGQTRVDRSIFTIDDIFIAAIGDSYSSGEGTPAGRVDPGESDDDFADAVREGHGAAVWAAGTTTGTEPIRTDRIREIGHDLYSKYPDTSRMDAARLSHHQAHRSVFAPSARVAMMIEDANHWTSVTYVNFAVSGATIRDGAELPSRIPELSSDIVQPPGGGPFRLEKSQLDALFDVAGRRRIDKLIVGFGGNDVGFARVLEALVLREGPRNQRRFGPSLDSIERAIRTGVWNNFERDFGILDDDVNVPGLDGLALAYRDLQDLIADEAQQRGTQIGESYLMGYPDITKINGGRDTCTFFNQVARRNQRLISVLQGVNADNLEITSWEAAWGIETLLAPLSAIQAQQARAYGWIYVPMPDRIFANGGICGPRPYDVYARDGYRPRLTYDLPRVSWFRAGEESFAIQSSLIKEFADATGLGHPNEFGYLAMGIQLRAAIARASFAADNARPQLFREDTTRFDPGRLRLHALSGSGPWVITDGIGSYFSAEIRAEGEAILAILQHFDFDEVNYIGRPQPEMTYFRSRGRFPAGSSTGLDCTDVDPRSVFAVRNGGDWQIWDGDDRLLLFKTERDARQAVEVVRRNRLNRLCFVGRPDPLLTFWLAEP